MSAADNFSLMGFVREKPIAKLASDAELGEELSVHYSGVSELPGDVEEWLKVNNIIPKNR